jgi:ABC-type phosphate transport system substrate-binding protein
MRKSIALGTFAALAAGSVGAGALDSVPSMRGSDTLKNITTAMVAQCTAMGTYPVDNNPAQAGNQPILYDGTGSSSGENGLKPAASLQWIAPMSRALGTGICDAAAPKAGAEGIVFALDGLSIAFGPVTGNPTSGPTGTEGAPLLTGATQGVDYTGTAGVSSNVWRTVLREVYAGMGASGNNIYARDCNSAARRALVSNWDNLFAGANPGTVCTDSNPDAATTEAGLRHAFRRDEESGTTDVFLAQLSLPAVNFQQTGLGNSSVVPTGSTPTQQVVYRALANSPFCNVRRPEDDYQPVAKGGSQIPPMYSVGVPAAAGTGLGLVPYDAALGDNARFLSPYLPEQMDQDPIRRRCFGPKVTIGDSPSAPREEVCSADGNLGLVLPINPPTGISQAARYPTIACEDTRDFEFGPAPTRPTGDAVRCPNGDAPQDGKCLLPTRTDPTQPGGFAFDCLNNGLNAPAAIYDTDTNGSEYPDAPGTDGILDADGRAYNLILRQANGTIRTQNRPNPIALGTMSMPLVGTFYRLHSSRSGRPSPNHTAVCASQDDATDQIGCLVQANPCSMGFAGGGAITNNPGTVAALVNGVAPTATNVQALVVGGTTYPIARKLYLNTIRGFDSLLTSSDPAAPTGKDAELDLAKCFANLPFSATPTLGTFVDVASSAFGFVALPAPVGGGNASAICEDFVDSACSGVTGNVDACKNNPAGIPSSACNNGYRDGDETGVDVCPAVRPTCNAGTCQ